VLFPKTGRIERICENAHYARYVESGHLIFLRDYVLMAVPFDVERLKITGSFVDLIDRVQGDSKGHPPSIAVSRNGTMVHSAYVSKSDVSRPEMRKYELLWVDREGRSKAFGAPTQDYVKARLSPDERQIALSVSQKGSSSIHVYDRQSGTVIPIVAEDGYRPVWSPDGRHIAFWSGNRQSVFRKVVGERGAAELLAREPFGGSWLWPHSWSPDGRFLACTLQFGRWDDIWILPLDGDRKPYPLLDRERLGEYNPTFSPDGQWLAYVLYDGAEKEVYLRQFPSSKGETQVSSGGGIGPIWSRDGRELFYMNVETMTMMAVQIGADPNSPVGTPEQLFKLEGSYRTAGNLGRYYDISTDGRFLMLRRVEDGEFRLICVQNWFEELKRVAPASTSR
jgi:Tol biopolymer transport system component